MSKTLARTVIGMVNAIIVKILFHLPSSLLPLPFFIPNSELFRTPISQLTNTASKLINIRLLLKRLSLSNINNLLKLI